MGTVMTNNNNGTRATAHGSDDPVMLAQFDATMAEAFQRMIRSLERHPHPHRWRQLGHTVFPCRMGGRMLLNAAAAGACHVDLEAPGHAWVQWARSLRGDVEFSPERLRLVSCREERANARVNAHQCALTGDESVDALVQMEHDIAAQMAELDELRRMVAQAKRAKQGEYRRNASLTRASRNRLAAGA